MPVSLPKWRLIFYFCGFQYFICLWKDNLPCWSMIWPLLY
nr:MAG TPA: hypothetical protein [Caudoviricetes sp.]